MTNPIPQQTPTAASVRSMTGFASVRTQTAFGEIVFSLRSVNGRNLDLHFHLGSEYSIFENALRALLKSRLSRGHVEVRMALVHNASSELGSFNLETLAAHLRAFEIANQRFNLGAKPDLNQLLQLPGIFDVNGSNPRVELAESDVIDAASRCIDELNSFRLREGGALTSAILHELTAIDSATMQMSAIRSRATVELQTRLRDRLSALLQDSHLPPGRLVEEVALIADRSDVQEELTRLGVHSRELRRIISVGGEVGKRLDFLLQEMNRETNTILSKTSGVGEVGLTMTNLGLDVKANIERIREQALNLE